MSNSRTDTNAKKELFKLMGPIGQHSPELPSAALCWRYLFGRDYLQDEVKKYQDAGWRVERV